MKRRDKDGNLFVIEDTKMKRGFISKETIILSGRWRHVHSLKTLSSFHPDDEEYGTDLCKSNPPLPEEEVTVTGNPEHQ